MVPKLFAVTLIRSRISRPWWIRQTLDALGLKKIGKTMIHKNTPSICGLLKQVKDMVNIKPLVIRTDSDSSPAKIESLLDNGVFIVTEKALPEVNNRDN